MGGTDDVGARQDGGADSLSVDPIFFLD